MRKTIIFFATAIAFAFSSQSMHAQSASDILSKLGTVANNVLGSKSITVADLEGSWKYVEPAVEFKSDNLLKKAGGSVASTTICEKLKPYYKKAGIEKMVMTVDSAANFKMAIGKISIPGTITMSETEGMFEFNFKAFGKIKAGSMDAYISKTATGQIKVTFDVSKLISLVETISSVSGNSTLKSVSSMLSSYDGLTAGFVMKKN